MDWISTSLAKDSCIIGAQDDSLQPGLMMLKTKTPQNEKTTETRNASICLPEENIQNLSGDQILDQTSILFRQLLENKRGDRAWMVFDQRFQFFSKEQHTFDEIGEYFKVTGQMIHLIHKDNLKYATKLIIERKTGIKGTTVKQEWITFIGNVHRVIGEATSTPCLEKTVLARLAKEFGITRFHPFMNLSYELNGVRKIEPTSGLDRVCFTKSISKVDADRIIHAIVAVDRILTRETSLPLSDMELLSQILKARLAKSLTASTLLDAVRLCSSVEITAGEKIWGKFTSLSRVNQIERILFEEGKPLQKNEIYKRLAQRLVQSGENVPGQRSLFNQISGMMDSRFQAIGKWGWKLAIWEDETRSIIELMVRCLQEAGSPLSSSEIEAYVAERRSVGKHSVQTYLTHPGFKKMGVDRWGLRDWKLPEGTRTWSPEEVAEFVASFYKRRKTDQVPYTDLRDAVAQEARITNRQVNGLLRINPVIKIQINDAEKRIAIFQADYSENLHLAHRPFGKRQETLEQKLQDETISYLRRCPGRQAALNDLIQRLTQKTGKPYRTIFTYLGRMGKKDLIEKTYLSRVPYIRVKMIFSINSFPAIEKIHSKDLRDWAIAALTYLNPAEIDKGLFELGKAFEHAVKCYLEKAIKKGTITCSGLSLNKIDDWNLATMVDCAWTNHLITDKGTFQFLKQERNDRAHGARISQEELDLYWTGAENFAGMFIQAIQLFDRLLFEVDGSETV